VNQGPDPGAAGAPGDSRRWRTTGDPPRRRPPRPRPQRRFAAGVIPAFPVYLFDIDGTLLDSARDICGAVQQVLAVNPSRAVTFDTLKSYIGRHLFDLFAEVIPDPTQERMDNLLLQYRTIYLARGHSQTTVYPGVAEGLAALGGRKGSPTTRAILAQFGLIQHFHHVQGTDGFPSKPAPDVLFTALAAMGARPED